MTLPDLPEDRAVHDSDAEHGRERLPDTVVPRSRPGSACGGAQSEPTTPSHKHATSADVMPDDSPNYCGSLTPRQHTPASTPGQADPEGVDNGVPTATESKTVRANWSLLTPDGVSFVNIVCDSMLTEGPELFVKRGNQTYGNTDKFKAVASNVRNIARTESGDTYGVDYEVMRVRMWLGKRGGLRPIISFMTQASQRDAQYDSGVGAEELEIWRKLHQINSNLKEAKRRMADAAELSAENQQKSAHAEKEVAAAMQQRSGQPSRPHPDWVPYRSAGQSTTSPPLNEAPGSANSDGSIPSASESRKRHKSRTPRPQTEN